MTRGALIPQPALASAARTGETELHGARHLRDVASAIALWANRVRPALASGSPACFAALQSRDGKRDLRAPDGLPEVDFEGVLEVRARLRLRRRPRLRSPSEHLAEHVAKAAPGTACAGASTSRGLRENVRKIESAEAHLGTLPRAFASRSGGVRGIEAVLVVHLLLLGVAQNVVGFLDLLEAILGGFFAGIQVGMVLASQTPVRFSDFLRFRVAGYPEGSVIVLARHFVESPGGRRARAKGRARRHREQAYFFFSSTSTNSASTTLSLGVSGLGGSAPGAPCPGC